GVEIDHRATVRAIGDDQFIVDDTTLDYEIPQSASMDRISLVYIREEMNRTLGTSDRRAVRPDGSIIYEAQLNPSGSIPEPPGSPRPDRWARSASSSTGEGWTGRLGRSVGGPSHPTVRSSSEPS